MVTQKNKIEGKLVTNHLVQYQLAVWSHLQGVVNPGNV